MKKGFTIIELLVASLLLGMLVTILTMIFNQSSIAWRTGIAGTTDLGDTRRDIAVIREEADNAFVADNKLHRLLGVFNSEGDLSELRTRACDVGSESSDSITKITGFNDSTRASDQPYSFTVRSEKSGDGSLNTYIVNVMSAGPDGVLNTYDDIWSFPDEFE